LKRLISQIEIGKFKFNYVTQVSIESSWDTFTDTARIVFLNRFRKKEGQSITVGIDNVFKRGDAVTIKLGYFPNLVTRFQGFISRVKPDSPLVIECEDEMFQLEQVSLVSKEFINTTIKDVIEYATDSLKPIIEFDDETAKIGNFHIDNKGFINAIDVFKVLKSQFGYNIYFRNKVLNVRILNSILALTNPTHRIGMQRNVIRDDLTYQRDDDVDMMIRFESKQTDNTVLTFFGFKDKGETVITTTAKTAGVTHAWTVPELSETEIKKIMRENIDKFIWEGFTGGFLTFLEPFVQHTDTIQLIDREHPEREGKYLIQDVGTEFGLSGGRQDITLRNRIA